MYHCTPNLKKSQKIPKAIILFLKRSKKFENKKIQNVKKKNAMPEHEGGVIRVVVTGLYFSFLIFNYKYY